MSGQNKFEAGLSELVKAAFNVEVMHCYKIKDLLNPLENMESAVLVKNQLGQSLLVDGNDVEQAVDQFHMHCMEQIQDLETKLFYAKARHDVHGVRNRTDKCYFVDPKLIDDVEGMFYLLVPLYDIAVSTGYGLYGHQVNLPLGENEALCDLPVDTATDVHAPVPYTAGTKGMEPHIWLTVKPNPEGSPLPNTVSVLARMVAGLGYFPVLYGAEQLFEAYDLEDLEAKSRDEIAEYLEKSDRIGEYFICTCEEFSQPLNGVLQLEHFDFFVPAQGTEEAISNSIIDWRRLDKSMSIWLDGRANGWLSSAEENDRSGEDEF